MNDTGKYANLVDYSIELRRNIKSLNNVFWSKPPKQMGSFSVTMSNVETIVANLKELQTLHSEMGMLVSLDTEAKKENKSARKVADQISSIREEINRSSERLKKEFFKQMEIAGKQCREVSRAIKDKDEKERFDSASKGIRLMSYEAKAAGYKIPLSKQEKDLEQIKRSEAREEHKKDEKEIDIVTGYRLENASNLESALNSLTEMIVMNPTDDLSNKVRKEVAEIKRALPPKTISIAKDSLERLRHSSHLILDLEQISEIMNTTHSFRGKDGKLQKISKKLESLQSLLQQAIEEERDRNSDIKHQYETIQGKVNYATDATRTYEEILNGNARLEQEQIQISNNMHSLQTENSRLKKDMEKSYDEAQTIHRKPENERSWNDGIEEGQLYERARNDLHMISENEAHMDRRMAGEKIRTLPQEYVNIKSKLQSASSLYQMQMHESQEMSNGGMSL